MMIPPFDFSSASMRLTTTRSCRGRNLSFAMMTLIAAGCAACVNRKLIDYKGLALSTAECHEAARDIRRASQAVKHAKPTRVLRQLAFLPAIEMALAGPAKPRHHAGQSAGQVFGKKWLASCRAVKGRATRAQWHDVD